MGPITKQETQRVPNDLLLMWLINFLLRTSVGL